MALALAGSAAIAALAFTPGQEQRGSAASRVDDPDTILSSRSPGERTGALLQTKVALAPAVRNRPHAGPAVAGPPPVAYFALPSAPAFAPDGFGQPPLGIPPLVLAGLPGTPGAFGIPFPPGDEGGSLLEPQGGNSTNPGGPGTNPGGPGTTPGGPGDTPSPVPESPTWIMMMAAFGLLGALLRRRPTLAMA